MLLAYTATALVCDYLLDMTDERIAPIAKGAGLTVLALSMIYYFVVKNKT